MAFTRNPSIDDATIFNWILVKDAAVKQGSRYLPLSAVTSLEVQPDAQGFRVSMMVQGETFVWGSADDETTAREEAMGLIERINSIHHPQAMAGLTPLA